jgi:hypothetical protein
MPMPSPSPAASVDESSGNAGGETSNIDAFATNADPVNKATANTPMNLIAEESPNEGKTIASSTGAKTPVEDTIAPVSVSTDESVATSATTPVTASCPAPDRKTSVMSLFGSVDAIDDSGWAEGAAGGASTTKPGFESVGSDTVGNKNATIVIDGVGDTLSNTHDPVSLISTVAEASPAPQEVAPVTSDQGAPAPGPDNDNDDNIKSNCNVNVNGNSSDAPGGSSGGTQPHKDRMDHSEDEHDYVPDGKAHCCIIA